MASSGPPPSSRVPAVGLPKGREKAGTLWEGIVLDLLKKRFEDHPERHPGITWERVERRLSARPWALEALARMEETGGEPDVVHFGEEGEELAFLDCVVQSPLGRRSLCYDDEALRKRKRNPPAGSAMAQAREMGVELMDEATYRRLQDLMELDTKTSSWVLTPEDVRGLGGALFCERRYGRTFTFHNGADSYYGARGWRGVLRV